MATKVNTKFVIALAAGLVLVGAGLIGAYALVYLKSGEDYIELGNAAKAEGDWKTASEYYGRAVGHDPANADWLELWLEALTHEYPQTQTEFENRYSQRYRAVLRQIAHTRRTDEAAHHAYLGELFDQFRRGGGGRGFAEFIRDEVAQSVAYYAGTNEQEEADRLRRYRGLAFAAIGQRVGSLAEGEFDQAEEDLEAALAADPGDGEAAVGLVQLWAPRLSDLRARGRGAEAEEKNAELRGRVAGVLEVDPDDVWARVFRIADDVDTVRLALPQGAPPEVRLEEFRRGIATLKPRWDGLLEWLAEREDRIPSPLIARLDLLEQIIAPERDRAGLARLLEARLERRPDDASLLLSLARLRGQRQEFDQAKALLNRLAGLPPLPLGLDGLLLRGYQADAPRQLALFELRRVSNVPASQREEVLAAAEKAKDEFVAAAGADAPAVDYIEGELALLRGLAIEEDGREREARSFYQTALTRFSDYNEATDGGDAEGVWREGQAALQLERLGAARESFERLIELQPANVRGLRALASVERALGTREGNERALALLRSAANADPDNAAVREEIARLEILLGERRSDDPVLAAVLEARSLLESGGDRAADRAGAERVLRGAIDKHGHDARLVRELAELLYADGRGEEAATVVNTAAAENPDDPVIERFQMLLNATDQVEALAEMVDQSEGDQLTKILRKRAIFAAAGRVDEAQELLDEASRLAPDAEDVLELRFLNALAARDFAEAERVAARAAELDADNAGGATFDARILAVKGEHARAAELLETAARSRARDARLLTLLAVEQRAAGDLEGAIESYREALQVDPRSGTAAAAFVQTLTAMRRGDEALAEARRLLPLNEGNRVFMNVYLDTEAEFGRDEGLARAIELREGILNERPSDRDNRVALIRLYTSQGRWADAERLINELEERGGRDLESVLLRATWFADQGQVQRGGEFRSGITLARDLFQDYILEKDPDEVTANDYLTMSRFMAARGATQMAVAAAQEAVPLQDAETMAADRLLGDIYVSVGETVLAAEAYGRVVEAGADDAESSYRSRLIATLLRLREFEEAERQLDMLSEEAAGTMTAMTQRADLLRSLGELDEAARQLDRTVAAHSDEAFAFIKRAEVLMSMPERQIDARKDLEEAIALDPRSWVAFQMRASLLVGENRAEEAIRDLQQAVRINPQLDGVLAMLIVQLIEQSRDADAFDEAIRVLELRPSDTNFALRTGVLFEERGLNGRAMALYERAWELSKARDVGLALIDTMLEASPPRLEAAGRVVDQMETYGFDPDGDPQIIAAQASIVAARGRRPQAAELLARAFLRTGESPGDQVQWARDVDEIFGEEGVAEQVTFLRRLRDAEAVTGIADAWLLYHEGTVLVRDEATQAEGESVLRALRDDEAQDGLIRLLAARLIGAGRYELEDYEGAAAAWREGLDRFPNDWEMHNNVAFTLVSELGEPAAALEAAERAVALNDRLCEVHNTHAAALIANGRLADAEAAIVEAGVRVRNSRNRVDVLLAEVKLALARRVPGQAASALTRAQTLVRTAPDLREAFEERLTELERELDDLRLGS